MEDFKIILYILAIVAYFIYTAWRKAFKTPDEEVMPKKQAPRDKPLPRAMPTPAPASRQQRPTAPATSFEDILREMQSKMDKASKQVRQTMESSKPEYKPAPQPFSYETTPAQPLSLEVLDQAREYERKVRARREAVLDFGARHRPKPQVNIYAEMFRNPQSVRQAFILTEIFNRKQY